MSIEKITSKIIKEAEDARDEVLADAKEKSDGILAEAKEKAEQHVKAEQNEAAVKKKKLSAVVNRLQRSTVGKCFCKKSRN